MSARAIRLGARDEHVGRTGADPMEKQVLLFAASSGGERPDGDQRGYGDEGGRQRERPAERDGRDKGGPG